MAYTPRPGRTIDWRELVERIDGPDRTRDSLYPVVYEFSNGRQFRDPGPTKGIYESD